MKKIIKYFLLIILILPLALLTSCSDTKEIKHSNFSADLDRIDYYEIKVDPREDGTLDMNYKITWTVLNSSSEGPLTWVKIGIPNCYINELKPLTNNIDEIEYLSEDGAYIRIDFDRKYYENETLTFEFSFHQERMYHLYDNEVYYDFVSGWFEEIQVSEIKVLWNNENVKESNTTSIEGNYLIWNFFDLYYYESIDVEVTYDNSSFVSLSEDLQYSDRYMTNDDYIELFVGIGIFVAIIIAVIIIIIKTQDPYMSNRGFIGRRTHINRYYYYHHYYSSGVNSKGVVIVNPNSSNGGVSGGSSCACACACACAGGGRAGCSRKDFNHHSIDVNKVKEQLKIKK